jgi:hypothetical protein
VVIDIDALLLKFAYEGLVREHGACYCDHDWIDCLVAGHAGDTLRRMAFGVKVHWMDGHDRHL